MEAEGIATSWRFVDQEPQQKCSSAAAAAVKVSQSGPQFDCSICLDFAVEPVVTFCGHLYCWPCIYRWLQVDPTSPRRCPVCKEPVSQNALVPLYGRAPTDPGGYPHRSLGIPNRPSTIGGARRHFHFSSTTDDEYINMRAPSMHRNNGYYYPWQVGSSSSVFGSTAGGVIGGLAVYVLPMLSRSNYVARPYLLETDRQFTAREWRVEESLHQLWVFLFCGAILCLLFF